MTSNRPDLRKEEVRQAQELTTAIEAAIMAIGTETALPMVTSLGLAIGAVTGALLSTMPRGKIRNGFRREIDKVIDAIIASTPENEQGQIQTIDLGRMN